MPALAQPPLHRHDRAILALALGQTSDQVGRALGVDGSTVRRWRLSPDFRAEIVRVRRQLLAEAVTALVGAQR